MNLMRDFQAKRLISRISSFDSLDHEEAKKATSKLKELGAAAIPTIINALEIADKQQLLLYNSLLIKFLNNATLPHYFEGLSHKNPHVILGISRILQQPQYDPNRLLDLFKNPDISKSTLMELLDLHKDRLNAEQVLRYAYTLETSLKSALLSLVAKIAEESLVPELINRLSGKDDVIRLNIAKILTRFNQSMVQKALHLLLNDGNKQIRQTALEGLSKMKAPMQIDKLCLLLKDPDLNFQSKVIEAIIRLNHPRTVHYLLDPLKDDSEYIRRAAVEILNAIGDTNSIKDLLNAIKDDDWWVRARAADALAKIGGPRVVQAVVDLIKDDDDVIRRAAIEILNSTKDKSALKALIGALEDPDWWVRERAIDAIVNLGNTSAIPHLLKLLEKTPNTAPIVIPAIASLGDSKAVPAMIKQLQRPEPSTKIEALHALAELTDKNQAKKVIEAVYQHAKSSGQEVQYAADEMLKRLETRLPGVIESIQAQTAHGQKDQTMGSVTALNAIRPMWLQTQAGQPIDINTLTTDDVIDNRYRFVRRVGKGAFGTVLLMDDEVVKERIVLKILHAQMSGDENMLKRFVRELRYARKITHPNVIRIYDFLTLNGLFAISMEYFSSHTLGAELTEKKPLHISRAVHITSSIAKGMISAHKHRIVHRDIKPANILINNRDLVKIVDFGVAAARSSGDTQLTKTGAVVGTPRYMAPEQIHGKRIDERTDIYSLGVLFYEMLTGSPPFDSKDLISVLYQHAQGKATPPHKKNPNIPNTLSAVVIKMMQAKPEKRYQSMRDVAKILGHFK